MTIGNKEPFVFVWRPCFAGGFVLARSGNSYTEFHHLRPSKVTVFHSQFSLCWIFVFIAGLYERHAIVYQSSRHYPQCSNREQHCAVLLFYVLAPYITVAPKIILVLYLVISFGIIALATHWIFFVRIEGRTRNLDWYGQCKTSKKKS